jgi:hypothetical protein
VGVVTRLRTGRSGVRLPVRTKRFLLHSERPYRSWDTPCLLSNGYRTFFAGVKWPGREANRLLHLVPASWM